MRAIRYLEQLPRRVWEVVWGGLVRYVDIDGEQRAAAFAYYAFFSLIPLVLLFVTIGSQFFDQRYVAAEIISFLDANIPLTNEYRVLVVETINGVVSARTGGSALAIGVLIWSSMRFVQALVRGVNRAWGTKEYNWWRLPLKNLLMVCVVGSALFLGIIMPTIVKAIGTFLPLDLWPVAIGYQLMALVVPSITLFYGFSMFFAFAPRGRRAFRQVWIGALVVTVLLQVCQQLFVVYVRSFGNFNYLYGTFAGIIALLLWIYLSGSIIILGACISAVENGAPDAEETVI